MKKLFTIIFLLAISTLVNAQTYIGDSTVSGTLTFTKAGSPYILNGTINVGLHSTLIIEPGVHILVDSNAIRINVAGKFFMNGTVTDSIYISPKKNNRSNFIIANTGIDRQQSFQIKYIVANNFDYLINTSSRNDTIRNSHIYNFITGLRALPIIDCYIHDSYIGIKGLGGYLVSNTTITNCRYAAYLSDSPDYNIQNCTFANNRSGLKDLFATATSSMYRTFTNNKVYNNQIGMEFYSSDGPLNFNFSKNEIYANDTGIVVYANLKTVQAQLFSGNKICNNKIYNLVYTNTNYDIDIQNVCWCTNEPASIRAKIYDGRINANLGYVDFSTYQKNCAIGPEIISPDSLTISGIVHQNADYLRYGKIIAHNLSKNLTYISSTDNSGHFTFDSLSLGTYILKGVPNPGEKFYNTYYPNTSDSSMAVKLTLGNSISQIDLYMNAITISSVPNDIISGYFSVYPNPVHSSLKVNTQHTVFDKIQISNLLGGIQQEIYFDQPTDSYEIDMKTANSGIYILKIESANGVYIKKIIKE